MKKQATKKVKKVNDWGKMNIVNSILHYKELLMLEVNEERKLKYQNKLNELKLELNCA